MVQNIDHDPPTQTSLPINAFPVKHATVCVGLRIPRSLVSIRIDNPASGTATVLGQHGIELGDFGHHLLHR
jgi:hypothetical protein